MELPEDLATLYRHWDRHVSSDAPKDLREVVDDSNLASALKWFIDERMAIWSKRQQGEELPYTNDPILREYRFCNILRELDRQTIEYHKMLLPLRSNFPLWLLNMFYARMVARPETVRAVGLLSFSNSANEELYERLLRHQRPRYGTPYVFPVSVILRSETPTRELFITRHLPHVMEKVAQEMQNWSAMSVDSGVKRICSIFGFNMNFLWTEVLIDIAYQYPDKIDLFARFPIGPGAAPTLKRIEASHDLTETAFRLGQLRMRSGVYYENRPVVLSAENWEGISCEFRKYTNLKSGSGRKRHYRAK